MANLVLDSLMELPVALRDSVKLVPGDNQVILVTEMPIDRRIFKLMDVNVVHIVGRMDVALKAQAEAFTLDFDMDRKISQEEKQAQSRESTGTKERASSRSRRVRQAPPQDGAGLQSVLHEA